MKREDVRRMLRRWAKAEDEIDALLEQVKAIVDEIDAQGDIGAQNLDGMPHGTTTGRPTEAGALKRITLGERYRERLDHLRERIGELEALRDRIECSFIWLSADEERVIRLKYRGHLGKGESNPKTYQQVGVEMGYTDRRIKQIEAAAVDIIADWLENNE